MGKNKRLKVHRQWLPGRLLCSIRSNRKWCKRRGSSLECQNCFFVYPIIDSNLKNFNTNIALSGVAAASGVNIPQIVKALGLMKDTADIYPTTGHQLYVNSEGERLPFRGSGFRYTSSGGVGALSLHNARSHVGSLVGFRSAYDEKLATEN